MTPEQWQRVQEVLDSVLSAPPEERGGRLDRACQGEAEVRVEVERLLQQLQSVGNFLNQPVLQSSCFNEGEIVAQRYRVTWLLGRGGMGEVYEVYDLLLKEPIALKTLRFDLARKESVVQRFQKEIQLARKVTHPNVCRIFEVGVHHFADGREPVQFFTMELLTGQTLSARLRTKGPMSREDAFPLIVQIAGGLQAAHEAGIVHRDFKSGNVILVPASFGERAVITDFGLAAFDPSQLGPDDTRTVQDVAHIAGTVAYMSPEQMTGGAITASSDIYSLGVVLFEMATGRLPFDSRHLVHSAFQRASDSGIAVRPLAPNIDPRWEDAIKRCLRKEPAGRFQSAAEVAAWFGGGAWITPRLWTRRQWIQRSATVGGPLLALGGILYWRAQPYHPNAAAQSSYEKGLNALHSMTYEAAREHFEAAVKADPKFALAYASLARAYDEMEYTDHAKDLILQAVSTARDWRLSGRDERTLLALQYTVSRNYDRALHLFQQMEAEASDADRPAAALESGWLAEHMDNTEAAAVGYRRALDQRPDYAAAKLRLGFILGRKGKTEDPFRAFDEAEGLYKAARDFEGVTETLYQRALLLDRRSRSQEALPILEQGLHGAQTVGNRYQEIRLHLLEGVVRRKLGDAAGAAQIARDAIGAAELEGMDNLAASGSVDLGNSYLVRGDLQNAEPILQHAVELAKRGKVRHQEARAQFSLGSLYEQKGQPAIAKTQVGAALPFFLQAGYRVELIQCKIVLGGAQDALAEYPEAIKVLTEAAEDAAHFDAERENLARERLGLCYRDQGDWPRALSQFEEVLMRRKSANQPGGFAQSYAAQMHWRLGRAAQAKALLADSQLAKPGDQSLRNFLEAVRAEIAYGEGGWSEARQSAVHGLDAVEANEEAAPALLLIQALVRIRTGSVSQGAEQAESVAARLEKAGVIGNAAWVRLATAEALSAVGRRQSASKFADDALEFYIKRQVWEGVWRGRAVKARVSAEPEPDRSAAQKALIELKALWSADALEGYSRRTDIQRLMTALKS